MLLWDYTDICRGADCMNMEWIKSIIKNPNKIIRFIAFRGNLNWIPDKLYLKLIFKGEVGYKLDLNNPLTFNQKLQWLKLYDRNSLYIKLVDKYEVRQYISDRIGLKYLIPLIEVYDNVEDIDWGNLPQRFVLKCTHGSGSNIICNDKSNLDIEGAKNKLNKWMKKNWYWFGREWPYKNVVPRIVCEEFISETNAVPEDYKFLCFNGKVKLIEVHLGRYANHTQDYYDIDWNKTEISQYGTKSNKVIEKPKCFDKMVELSEILSRGMKHVRVDWFVVRDKLYFGEITFYDASGFDKFDNYEDDVLLGSWIDLDN